MSSTLLHNLDDTIAAEASPHGRGGVGVIRVSGKETAAIVGRLFDRELPEPGRHRYGKLVGNSSSGKALIDEVVLVRFQAPHSYTGEDVIEISTHGSPVIVAAALDELYLQGVRPARPGEFTLRAYLNGRIDLTQAEAVADLVNASSREAADMALKQLGGEIGKAAQRVSDNVLKLLIQCELELDFVEEEFELMTREEKIDIIEDALSEIERMLCGYEKSRRLREGVRVAIIGPPNVGKSSLFNTLIEADRAIVHPRPGTTRDVLNGNCQIKGVTFDVFDTAGIRITEDEIEDEGVRRAIETAENAEIKIRVTSVDMDELYGNEIETGGEIIDVLNKIDLGADNIPEGYIPLSARTGEGITDLKERIYRTIMKDEKPVEATINRERHYRAAAGADEALKRSKRAILEGYPAEMIAEELREAVSNIDDITGKNSLEGLLDSIFAEFCIGK